MKHKRLYVSDLDGTLLNQKGYLSTFSRRKLKELIASGTLFTIASARSLTTIRERLGELPLKLPIIHMNGGWITDYSHQKEYAFSSISHEETLALAKILTTENSVFIVSGKLSETERAFCSIPPKDRRNKPLQNFINERLKHNDSRLIEEDFLATTDKTKLTVSFTLIEQPANNTRVLKKINAMGLNQNLAIYPMGEGLIDGQRYEWTTIQSKLATKGNGALFIANLLGVSPENLIVFGDNVNDRSLFEVARHYGGEAILMRNGSSELQNIATQIIGYHYDDSVIKHILETEQKLTKL